MIQIIRAVCIVLISLFISGEAQGSSLTNFVGAKAEGILLHPDRIESYRLGQMYSPKYMPNLEGTSYLIEEKGPLLNTTQTNMIRQMLSKPKSYRKELRKDCHFQPGVGLVFRQGKEKYYALFCFGCNEWALENPEHQMVYADFETDKTALQKLALELFPGPLGHFNFEETK